MLNIILIAKKNENQLNCSHRHVSFRQTWDVKDYFQKRTNIMKFFY